jgi:hypothetical protein
MSTSKKYIIKKKIQLVKWLNSSFTYKMSLNKGLQKSQIKELMGWKVPKYKKLLRLLLDFIIDRL